MSSKHVPKTSWTVRQLSKVAQIIDPHPSHRAPDAVIDGVPFAGIGDLTERGELLGGKARVVPRSVLAEHRNRYRLSRNSIGFGRVASIGKVIDFRQDVPDLTISPTMAVIEPFGINREFLLHSLRGAAVREAIDQWLTGSTRTSLGIELLRQIPIATPDVTDQIKIGAILSTIDTAIEQTEALIEKYQHIKAGLMHDLFTRGMLPNGQLRPPREQAPELYQETAIGWIPVSWTPMTLRQLVGSSNIVNGPFGSDLLTSELKREGVPVLYVQDVKAGLFNRVSTANVTALKASQLAFCNVKAGDVLVAKVGAPPCDSCVYELDEQAIVTQDVIRIRPTSGLNPHFMSAQLNSDFGRKTVKRISIEGTRERVSLTQFKDLVFPFAPIAEQDEISLRLISAQANIAEELRKCRKLKVQKLGLMQDLLTGKVPVQADAETPEPIGA